MFCCLCPELVCFVIGCSILIFRFPGNGRLHCDLVFVVASGNHGWCRVSWLLSSGGCIHMFEALVSSVCVDTSTGLETGGGKAGGLRDSLG